MGNIHRPQVVTVPVFYPIEYYYHRPQTVYGPGGGNAPPAADDELIEETLGVFDHLLFDSGGGDDGFVLIEET